MSGELCLTRDCEVNCPSWDKVGEVEYLVYILKLTFNIASDFGRKHTLESGVGSLSWVRSDSDPP